VSAGGFRVVIGGGGVAGLEAALALRELVRSRAEVEVIAPEGEFAYRQIAVGEPFSLGEVARFDLASLVRSAGATPRVGALAEVRPDEGSVATAAGEEVPYDALLLAMGARPREALPGAITYRGVESSAEVRRAILALDRGEISSLAFAVPATVAWPLPLYELALLGAAHLGDIGDAGADLHLVTHEAEPLGLFGEGASSMVRDLLAEAGVTLHTGVAPARAEAEGLVMMSGATISADRVIALPRLEATEIPGVPQGPHGFIDTDLNMRVDGLTGVFAAGDATWFPIKQGGLAAQQADAAASAIAARIDPRIEPRPFRPVLRAALLTGSGPRYLRTGVGDAPARQASSAAPLWWPPSKVAGTYLAPFMVAQAAHTNQPPPPLADLEPRPGDEGAADAEEHALAIEMALAAADADADAGDLRGALRWLAVAEELGITLPAAYALKREQWRELDAG
jgi:sulfide:quinone oxidoreductase